MVYYKLVFVIFFLPLTIIAYQIFPKRFRWVMLLLASVGYYFTFSVINFIFPIAAAVATYGIGLALGRLSKNKKDKLSELKGTENKEIKAKVRAKYQRLSRIVLTLGILALLACLLHLKYYSFFAENINKLFGGTAESGIMPQLSLVLPLGISFYTMQAISYMVDVYWEKIPAERNPFKLLLFLCFFPTIIEGPIALYKDIREDLFAGHSILPQNIIRGYTRFAWGVMKKLVISDRLAPAVTVLFDVSRGTKGAEVVAAAVIYTIMEYMDFSACMDMVIGCAIIFGIKLPENFRQPFLARNASEFWRRWHITLGVWFKTYIFYPVSMSGLAKKWGKFAKGRVNKHMTRMVASAMALLPVWVCNGLWHGPKWTYIVYGLFYFVVIVLELLLEPVGDKILELIHTSKENKVVNVIRIIKTWIIIFLGELIFKADNLTEGIRMLRSIGDGFTPAILWNGTALNWRLDVYDWLVVLVMLIVVLVVNIIREKGIDVTEALIKKPMIIRWALVLSLILVIAIFGLYGPGFEEVDLVYAGF